MSSKITGMFVTFLENGSTQSDKVKTFDTYQEMLDDTSAIKYGIVDNTVYRREASGWVVGFPNVEKDDDYTAFEVWPTSSEIPVGTYTQDGITYNIEKAIAASATHVMWIRSEELPDQQNVVVDWGDGTIEALSSFAVEDLGGSEGDYRYICSHTYTELDKRYIVKIFGDTYFSVMNDTSAYQDTVQNNIISRALDKDLPVARHITNISSFCRGSRKLFKVDVSKFIRRREIINWAYLFCNCYNLNTAVGFGTLDNLHSAPGVFSGCTGLRTTDYRLCRCPIYSTYIRETFNGCKNLTVSVLDLLPYTNFFIGEISAATLFQNSGVVVNADNIDAVAAMLWNNPNVTWIKTTGAFKGCSAETRALVPTSWGGLAA